MKSKSIECVLNGKTNEISATIEWLKNVNGVFFCFLFESYLKENIERTNLNVKYYC